MSMTQQEELEAAITVCQELLENIEKFNKNSDRDLVINRLIPILVLGPELPSHVETFKMISGDIILYRYKQIELSYLKKRIESLKNVLVSESKASKTEH